MANISNNNSGYAAAVASFRQQSKVVTTKRQPRVSSGIPSFIDRYVPTEGAQPDVVRILRGNYETPYVPEDFSFDLAEDGKVIESVNGGGVTFDRKNQLIELPSIRTIFFMFAKHYISTSKKTSICSGGPLRQYKALRSQCDCCDEYQNGTVWENGKKVKESRVSRQQQYSFGIIHYKKHHKVPQTDEKGAVLKNAKGEAYTSWEPCSGRGCTYCLTDVETVDYRLKHWDLGYNNYNEIVDGFSQIVGQVCGVCGAKGDGLTTPLRWEAFTCPICDHVFFDETTTLSDEELYEVTKNPMLCPNAAQHPDMPKVLPQEHLLCSACNQSTHRAEICDVDLYVRRTAIDDKKFTLNLTGFSDLKPIDPQLLLEAEKFDVSRYFAPTPIDVQRSMLSAAPRSGGARSYSK